MSLWQFSESSQVLLKQCIEASSIDDNNKWIQKFGSKSLYFNENNQDLDANSAILNNSNNEDIAIANNVIEILNDDENTIEYEIEENKDSCCEILELDPVIHFDYVASKCLKNPKLFLILAEQLHIGAVEKLCELIYNNENVDSVFVSHFYTQFLPTFLKKEPSRLSLDLIIKARCYPENFKKLLAILIQDVELPNNIINEYVLMLNSNEKMDFLKILTQLNVTNEVFIHHLSAIHTAYKNSVSLSQNNIELQNYIVRKLIEISDNCKICKKYGRFLLTYLQSLGEFPTNITELQSVIDNHVSPFRKPCLNVLSELKKEKSVIKTEETFY